MGKLTSWKIPILGLLFLVSFSNLNAQEEQPEKKQEPQSILESDREIMHHGMHNLEELFGLGSISGHLRNYFMSTINDGALTDYYANAIGGAMHFRSHDFYGFQFGTAGIFTYKAFSSDLNKVDPVSGRFSRWEHELFDVLDFDNFNDLDRLEELYVRYNLTHGFITYGKMEIADTPLMNRQDGRMKPFAFKGVWFHYALAENHQLQATWIDRISPRSTVEWFDFNEGVGLTDQGFQPDGSPAEYREYLESDGLAMLGYQTRYKDFSLEFYQWYIHHISHTSWIGLEYEGRLWRLGLQYTLQFPDRFQKGLEYGQRYVQPGEHGQVLSGRVDYLSGDWSVWAAYSHAFDSGRFLFPRTLGRDQFYTSLPRSRMEGFGNTDVITLGVNYDFEREHLMGGLAYTRLFGPETDAFEFNKYNVDAYQQFNVHLEYAFTGFAEGLHMSLLYIYKNNLNNTAPEVLFNQSNLHQLNFVTNFEF